jgi:hypothetical protein
MTAMRAGCCLAGYLMGVPVTSYSLAIGEQHVEFAEAKIQARIITRDLSDTEIDGLAVVAVAGERLTAAAGWVRCCFLCCCNSGLTAARFKLNSRSACCTTAVVGPHRVFMIRSRPASWEC